jgi:hypothetical protein
MPPCRHNDRRDHAETFTGERHAKQVASWCACHLAAHDHTIAGDEHFLDIKLHVRDGVREIRDNLYGRVAAPTFARQITRAGFIIGGKDLFLYGFDIASADDVEQAVPWGNYASSLCLAEALR